MKKLNFTVLIEEDKDAGGYVATVPSLRGCFTQGETLDELMENVKEVIELCLEDLAKVGGLRLRLSS